MPIMHTPTSRLRKGDIVRFYGATYRLTEDARKTLTHPDNFKGEMRYVYVAQGELVQGSPALSMPVWTFQGNDYAAWNVEA